MLNWTFNFFVLAIIAALFGFGGIATTAVELGRITFVIFLVLFLVSLFNGRRVSPGGDV